MCGIFGVMAAGQSNVSTELVEDSIKRLFRLSESRGKESAGLALLSGDSISVLKQPIPASRFIRTPTYRRVLGGAFRDGNSNGRLRHSVAIMGHSRLVTNGAQEDNRNNQPVVAGDIVGIHNGIIVNDQELWQQFPDMRRHFEVDTEVLLSLIRHFCARGDSLLQAAGRAFAKIDGCAAVSLFFSDFDHVLLATNNGSLYLCRSRTAPFCLYASEEFILKQMLRSSALRAALGDYELTPLRSGEGRLLDLNTGTITPFSFGGPDTPLPDIRPTGRARQVVDLSAEMEAETRRYHTAAYSPCVSRGNDDAGLLFCDHERIDAIRRCTRCILPETFPYITFDQDGVCSYCRSHEKTAYLGHDALARQVAPFRSRHGEPDVLVGVSGGRDSCYGLHYVQEELGLHPIAYTYDWGMVTDLARRNVSRMCARLGVEHILISANIGWKRSNVRKNVKAWLRKPDLGIVPLFMAGDKQFFYYANQLKKRTGIKLFLFCAGNRYEATDFKVGFCRIREGPPGGILTSLSLRNKIKLAMYYGRQYLGNPGYINSSVWDTLFAFFASYMMPHDYLHLFHYIPWDEDEVLRVLRDKYDWELAGDTAATWRIGDGTAPFYNYIYYTVAGFTEMDTFRSRQIRDGVLDRETALRRVREENAPRYQAIKWYLNSIAMDLPFNDVIRTINAIPKLY